MANTLEPTYKEYYNFKKSAHQLFSLRAT